MSLLAKWEYMHWFVIALLGVVIFLTHLLFRSYRSMKKLPLYGIDWLGALLWGAAVMCVIFVCVYGEHYDWFQSKHILLATVAAVVMVALNVWRASFIRHPYINNRTWRYKEIVVTVALYLAFNFLLAPSHLLEHIYIESILGYDALHAISLNWVVLLGVVASAVFTYFTFALRKWSYKRMTVIAVSSIALSLILFYFTIDFNQSKLSLVLPIFLRSFGYVIIGICFLTILSRIPFHHFPQSLAIQGFFSAAISGVLGTAVLGRIFKTLVKSNSLLLTAELDNVNPIAVHIPHNELYGMVQAQSVMVSMKELYGWLALLALCCLLLFMIKESSITAKSAIHPTFRTIRRFVKHQLRMDKKGDTQNAIT